jgi:hypothetical protein
MPLRQTYLTIFTTLITVVFSAVPLSAAKPSEMTKPDSAQGDSIPSETLTVPAAEEGDAPVKPAPSGLEKALKELNLPGIEINLKERCVDVAGVVCLENGVLELIACTKDTKEHESILVIEAKPSHVHTALLLFGAKPGNPAKRQSVGKEARRWVDLPPQGGRIDVMLVFEDEKGKMVERPISDFISPSDAYFARGSDEDQKDGEEREFPTHTFLFAGSILHQASEGSPKYLADTRGHLISIATFGDEVICLPGIHDHSNEKLLWQVNSEHLPKIGSNVTLRLRPKVDPAKK